MSVPPSAFDVPHSRDNDARSATTPRAARPQLVLAIAAVPLTMEGAMLKTVLAVFFGGGLGAAARMGVSLWLARRFGETFPVGTLVANVSGSMLIGFLAVMTGPDGRWLASPELRMFLLVGVLGGYTTFSSFSLQTMNLVRDAQYGLALVNIGTSVILCIVGCWLGMVAAEALK